MRTWMLTTAVLMVGLAGCASDDGRFEGEPVAVICTNFGAIVVELYLDETPVTAQNFLDLAFQGEYDDVPFHRIISNFMMQGGDVTNGDGSGGKTAHGGILPDETTAALKHDRAGLLSMANKGGDPTTGSSQFFITFVPTPHLDGIHTVFGEVVAGMEVVQEVEERAASSRGTPQEDVTMIKVVPGVRTDAVCPPLPQPEPAVVSADSIIPGRFPVNHASDSLLVWARNTGEAAADVTFAITGAGGTALPEGWSIAIDDPAQTLRGGRAVHTMARLTVPPGTTGSFDLELQTGPTVTPIVADVALDAARVAKEGDAVDVRYAGRCIADGRQFDAGDFPLTLGGGRAITGFDLGLVGMALEETQTIVIPAPLAYGNGGPCGALDPADLAFDVTITSFDS